MARYWVHVGNATPDEHSSFNDALRSYRRQGVGARIWRNDESDSGDHEDGLSRSEISRVSPSDHEDTGNEK